MVASDGGIFTFGDARFFGSTGDIALNQPIVGMAPTPTGRGYWLVASDGGIFTFGDARFFGSTGNIALNQPIVGMASTPTSDGYWLAASDGGIFTFGTAGFHGSLPGQGSTQKAVGIEARPSGRGYWIGTTGRLGSTPRPDGIAYTLTDELGRPGRWDPCKPIRWRLNLDEAPAGATGEVSQEAVRRLASATGLDLRYEGTTSVVPGPGHDPRTDGIDLLIGWRRGDFYQGGATASRIAAWSRTDQGVRIEAAEILLNPDAPMSPGFNAGDRAQWGVGTRLMYRLANVAGVISISPPNQILSSSSPGAPDSQYGPDDRAALRTVGAERGCLSGPARPTS
jgi:hypothetical protein